MPPSMRWSSVIPSSSACVKQICPSGQTSRCFSATARSNATRVTRQRRELFRWLNSQGAHFREPLPGSTNYLGAYDKFGQLRRVVEGRGGGEGQKSKSNPEDDELIDPDAQPKADAQGSEGKDSGNKIPPERKNDLRPFPLNRTFHSESVLSEDFRERIWESVMKQGLSVRQVSANYGVEMSRVGAVVRLKEIEKEWQREGKTLARPYARAVMGMLPQTKLDAKAGSDTKSRGHESINDLPVHPATTTQIFHPTSESRHFTREDAAKVFDENLLTTEKRIPHPELVKTARDRAAGLSREEVQKLADGREEKEMMLKQEQEERVAKKAAAVKKVDSGRWEFRFEKIHVDHAGLDGRGIKGTGWRYGAPLMDRKKGQVKIPTRVR